MSLIEALIALAIAAILMAAAMPMYSTWVMNTQIRTGAEAIVNGLQIARSEALNRNANVQFAMTGSDTGWQVSSLASDGTVVTVIQTRSGGAGSATATATPFPSAATAVTFNALGRKMLPTNPDNSVPIQQINITTSITSSTGARALNITISDGGQVRMCDPAFALPDSRGC